MLGDFTAMYLIQFLAGININSDALQSGTVTIEMFYVLFAGILGGFLGYLLVKKQLQDHPAEPAEKE